jgi:hypothetical protein
MEPVNCPRLYKAVINESIFSLLDCCANKLLLMANSNNKTAFFIIRQFYSAFKLFTGFATAAFIDLK